MPDLDDQPVDLYVVLVQDFFGNWHVDTLRGRTFIASRIEAESRADHQLKQGKKNVMVAHCLFTGEGEPRTGPAPNGSEYR